MNAGERGCAARRTSSRRHAHGRATCWQRAFKNGRQERLLLHCSGLARCIRPAPAATALSRFACAAGYAPLQGWRKSGVQRADACCLPLPTSPWPSNCRRQIAGGQSLPSAEEQNGLDSVAGRTGGVANACFCVGCHLPGQTAAGLAQRNTCCTATCVLRACWAGALGMPHATHGTIAGAAARTACFSSLPPERGCHWRARIRGWKSVSCLNTAARRSKRGAQRRAGGALQRVPSALPLFHLPPSALFLRACCTYCLHHLSRRKTRRLWRAQRGRMAGVAYACPHLKVPAADATSLCLAIPAKPPARQRTTTVSSGVPYPAFTNDMNGKELLVKILRPPGRHCAGETA